MPGVIVAPRNRDAMRDMFLPAMLQQLSNRSRQRTQQEAQHRQAIESGQVTSVKPKVGPNEPEPQVLFTSGGRKWYPAPVTYKEHKIMVGGREHTIVSGRRGVKVLFSKVVSPKDPKETPEQKLQRDKDLAQFRSTLKTTPETPAQKLQRSKDLADYKKEIARPPGQLTDASAMSTINDTFGGIIKATERKKAVKTYIKLVGSGTSRLDALDEALSTMGIPSAKENKRKIIKDIASGKRFKSDGVNWNEVTP